MILLDQLKSLPLFQPPEVTLKRRLEDNPTYPFEPVLLSPTDQYPVHQYKRRLPRFYYSVAVCCICVLFCVVWAAVSTHMDLLYIPCGVLVAGVLVMADTTLKQTLIIDPHHGYYSVYVGKKLVATHHCHNIYVRIMTRPGSGKFWAVINGVNLDTAVKLSFETSDKKALRGLCKRLASKLSINYFDTHNHSKHHVVRHKKPQVSPTLSSHPPSTLRTTAV